MGAASLSCNGCTCARSMPRRENTNPRASKGCGTVTTTCHLPGSDTRRLGHTTEEKKTAKKRRRWHPCCCIVIGCRPCALLQKHHQWPCPEALQRLQPETKEC